MYRFAAISLKITEFRNFQRSNFVEKQIGPSNVPTGLDGNFRKIKGSQTKARRKNTPENNPRISKLKLCNHKGIVWDEIPKDISKTVPSKLILQKPHEVYLIS